MNARSVLLIPSRDSIVRLLPEAPQDSRVHGSKNSPKIAPIPIAQAVRHEHPLAR